MTDHATEFCPCGHKLRVTIELDTGLCLSCLQHEDDIEHEQVPVGESFEWERGVRDWIWPERKGARA